MMQDTSPSLKKDTAIKSQQRQNTETLMSTGNSESTQEEKVVNSTVVDPSPFTET